MQNASSSAKTAIDFLSAACAVVLVRAAPQWTPADPAQCLPRAKAAAGKALEIDNQLAEAHASLGLVLFNDDLNLRESKREFERAIELNPGYAAAHHWLGNTALAALGELDYALAEMKRAVELDPFSLIINTNLGYVTCWRGVTLKRSRNFVRR